MTPALRDRVAAVYRAADAAVAEAGPRCDASGRCCRFTEYGHTLYLSDLEAEFLLESAPPFAGPVSPDSCPYQVGGLCTAREPRPLGCRVYFCDPAFQERMPKIIEAGIRELKRIADDAGRPWRYAPLHAFLGQVAPTATRRSLPVVKADSNHKVSENTEEMQS